MTNIRTNGFDSEAQRREHVAEAEDYVAERRAAQEDRALRSQIDSLRNEVRQLRSKVEKLQAPAEEVGGHPWLRAGATLAATFVLGRLSRAMRLGPVGAIAAPVLGSRIAKLI